MRKSEFAIREQMSRNSKLNFEVNLIFLTIRNNFTSFNKISKNMRILILVVVTTSKLLHFRCQTMSNCIKVEFISL